MPTRHHFSLRVLRRIAPLLAILLVVITVYNAVASQLVTRTDNAAPRDPETGILIGAEALDLGPRDAPTAVLLTHGFIGGSSNFGDLPKRLADMGHRVVALRLPGHGTSPREFAETDADEILEAVVSKARELREQHQHLILVGHSMGSALSALAASDESLEIDGLVLAAPYFRVTHKWYYILRPETWNRAVGWAFSWVYKGDAFIRVKRKEARPDILSYRWVPSSGSATLMEIGRRARATETLDAITCPTLILHGPGDNAADPAAVERAFEALASEDKKLHWLQNSDHHIFWDYDREEAIDLIAAFVDRVSLATTATTRLPIPDKTVVLTFDDSVKSHLTNVAPVLQQHDFGATFFITHQWMDDTENFMSWNEVAQLHEMGFEIGNHSWTHPSFNSPRLAARMAGELALVENELRKVGVPKPISFAWTGNAFGPESLAVLRAAGYVVARRGMQPEIDYGKIQPGPLYDPHTHDPLLIPTAGDAYPDWILDDFKAVVDRARDGRIAVVQFHGVPDVAHPWVHTEPELFEAAMQYLKEENFNVIAMRDLVPWLSKELPSDPMTMTRYPEIDPTELAASLSP